MTELNRLLLKSAFKSYLVAVCLALLDATRDDVIVSSALALSHTKSDPCNFTGLIFCSPEPQSIRRPPRSDPEARRPAPNTDQGKHQREALHADFCKSSPCVQRKTEKRLTPSRIKTLPADHQTLKRSICTSQSPERKLDAFYYKAPHLQGKSGARPPQPAGSGKHKQGHQTESPLLSSNM